MFVSNDDVVSSGLNGYAAPVGACAAGGTGEGRPGGAHRRRRAAPEPPPTAMTSGLPMCGAARSPSLAGVPPREALARVCSD